MSALFNGATSYFAVPTGSYLNCGNQWTISCWAKFNGTGDIGAPILSHWLFHRSGAALADANTISIRFIENTNAIGALFRDSNNAFADHAVITGELAGSGWYHFVMVRQRNNDTIATTVLYVNNVLVDTDNTHANLTGVNFTTPLLFGRRGDTSSATTLSGQLAEWAKFDRCLSKTEITQLYNGHDPELLSNGRPAVYFPMRNNYVDKIIGITGIGITNMTLSLEHPIPDKLYYPINNQQNTLPQLDSRVGILEQRGYLDFIDWTPGGVPPTGISQTGAFFSQARLGDGYIVAPNRSLSGCTVTAYASGGADIGNSGRLQMIISNLSPLPVDLSGSVRFSVYRL